LGGRFSVWLASGSIWLIIQYRPAGGARRKPWPHLNGAAHLLALFEVGGPLKRAGPPCPESGPAPPCGAQLKLPSFQLALGACGQRRFACTCARVRFVARVGEAAAEEHRSRRAPPTIARAQKIAPERVSSGLDVRCSTAGVECRANPHCARWLST
jgi:hypothetical protein